MGPGFRTILVREFPSVFPDDGFHFECESGWFPLVYDVSQVIDRYNKQQNTKDKQYCSIYATQIKEKFGTLRYYTSTSSEPVDEAIDIAESKSGTVCEMCGYQGSRCNELSWIKTLCKNCLASWKLKLKLE